MAEFDGVNSCMKVVVVGYWCRVVMRNERCTPYAEELINSGI